MNEDAPTREGEKREREEKGRQRGEKGKQGQKGKDNTERSARGAGREDSPEEEEEEEQRKRERRAKEEREAKEDESARGGDSRDSSSNGSSSSTRRHRNFATYAVPNLQLNLEMGAPCVPGRKKEEDVAEGKPKEGQGQEVDNFRQKARVMKKRRNPEWKLVCAQIKELMDREQEDRKDPHAEALRREANDLRMIAREAQAK
jgi:hypothetical protein